MIPKFNINDIVYNIEYNDDEDSLGIWLRCYEITNIIVNYKEGLINYKYYDIIEKVNGTIEESVLMGDGSTNKEEIRKIQIKFLNGFQKIADKVKTKYMEKKLKKKLKG